MWLDESLFQGVKGNLISLLYTRRAECELTYPCFRKSRLTLCHPFTKGQINVTWYIHAPWSQWLPDVTLLQKENRGWLDTSLLLVAKNNLMSPLYKRRTVFALTYPCFRESRLTWCYSCTKEQQDMTWYIPASGSQTWHVVTLLQKDNRVWLDEFLLYGAKDNHKGLLQVSCSVNVFVIQ